MDPEPCIMFCVNHNLCGHACDQKQNNNNHKQAMMFEIQLKINNPIIEKDQFDNEYNILTITIRVH
jgi:hypothetical protein